MKKKVLCSVVVGFALLLLAALLMDNRLPRQEVPVGEPPEPRTLAVPFNGSRGSEETISTLPESPSTNVASGENSRSVAPSPDPETTTREARQVKLVELADLQMNEDAGSLSKILHELENPDKEIRDAALQAAIQFGERTNTIARLKELETRTTDSQERKAIQDAIEFIALPSLTEVMNERTKAVSGSSGKTTQKVGNTVFRPSISRPPQTRGRLPSPGASESAP